MQSDHKDKKRKQNDNKITLKMQNDHRDTKRYKITSKRH